MKILNNRFAVLLLLLAMFTGVSQADDGDTASCSEVTTDYQLALDYAIEVLHITIDEVTIKLGRYTIGTVTYLEMEYYSIEGQALVASGTIELSDTCNDSFAEKTEDWYCQVTTVEEMYEIIVAEGSGLVVVLTYEEWKEKLGPVTLEHETTDIWALYYEYVLTLYMQVTTATTDCLDLPEAGPRPPAISIRAWGLQGPGPFKWQTRDGEVSGEWNDVLLPDESVFYPNVEVRNRLNELDSDGVWSDIQMVALIIPNGGDANLENYRVLNAAGQETGWWLDIDCEFVASGGPCVALDERPENRR